ncbi:MAG: transporter, substrate binding protein [Rhizobium sp.]|nr:transporter, substrate binding protein [Rhizobium sp.]
MKKMLLSAVAVAAMVAFGGMAKADLLIGVAGPLTGANAAFGAQLQKGAEQAAKDINDAGGINGEMIKIVLGDDVSDPKQGISVANKFVGDGVKFVVGHFNSGVSIPTSEVYAENGIMQITPASTNPKFTERGLWNTFRTCGRDDQQGAVAGQYIADHFKDGKIAVVHDKTPYGQGLADETKKAMNGLGITEVVYEGITPGEKDYSALIAKMKDAGVTLVYFGGLHTEAGLIMRQMADQGMKAPLMSGDGITSNELASIAGDAVDGTFMTFPPDPRKNPNAADAVKKFRDAGFEPEAYTLYSYAAVQIIVEAAKLAGNNDPMKVAETAKAKGPFKTVIGDIGFDAKGDITRPDYTMYQWKKGDDGKYTYFEIGTK